MQVLTNRPGSQQSLICGFYESILPLSFFSGNRGAKFVKIFQSSVTGVVAEGADLGCSRVATHRETAVSDRGYSGAVIKQRI